MKMQQGKTISIKKGLFYLINTIVFVTIVLFALIWFLQEYNELKSRIAELEESHKQRQKDYLVSELNHYISQIDLFRAYSSNLEEDSIKMELIKQAQKQKIDFGGYIFINEYAGQALLFDGQIMTDSFNVSDMTDPSGKRLFDIEKEAFHTENGLFMNYEFKPTNSDIPEPKLSYMKGYSDWDWIIGVGIYVSKPDKEIAQLNSNFENESKLKLLKSLLLLFFFASLTYFILRYINKRLLMQISIFKEFLHKAAFNEEEIKLNDLLFQELRDIAVAVNNMTKESHTLNTKIREQDHHIKSIFEAADNIAFIITDIQGENSVITEFSPGAENIFGYRKEEIIGKEVAILHRKQDVKRFPLMQKLLTKGKKGFDGETVLINKQGEEFPALFTLHPLMKDNEIIATIGVAINISQRKKAENALKLLKENLEQKVSDRTTELQKRYDELQEKNDELEKYNTLFVGREFRIKELREKVKELEKIIQTK
ncbi:MAG: PAS domain S-box protein [Bacteroidetes bacterium]|nr:PAS domain S-box protein [Bacteroidota bacterium]